MKISVCLATFNEEKNIKACLESVKWADEIVIVDGSSTDKTVALAKKYTSKITIRENPLMFHLNKQKAFEKATGDWILYLDADERVSEDLKKEIREAVKNKAFNGFWIPRKNIIFGQWIRYTGWYPDYQLRLFRQGKAYLPCQSVHEQPQLTGHSGKLKNPLIHENYQKVSQYIKRLNELYTENDKNLYLTKKQEIKWQDAFIWPVNEFFKRFFKEKGYKDGLHGLILSLFQAFSSLVTFAKVWEVQGFKKQELPLNDFFSEMKKLGKETSYWITTALIDKNKQPVKKTVLKIKRRWQR